MLKHYGIALLLFILIFGASRKIVVVINAVRGMFSHSFGRDVERDVWELRRYAYLAYPVIQARKQYFRLYDTYPEHPYDSDNKSWNDYLSILYLQPLIFPYYKPFMYQPISFLQEPIEYKTYVRMRPGLLCYDTNKNAWWLDGFDYLDCQLDEFPVLINLSKNENRNDSSNKDSFIGLSE